MVEEIGKVFTYFSKIGVAGIEITNGALKVGDTIRIKGATTDFEMAVDSMQIDKDPVDEVSAGRQVGMKVRDKVRPGDVVYKV